MPKYRCIIFDFDGTLANTEESIIKAFQKTLRELNLPPVEDSKIKKLIGLSLKTTFEKTTKLKDESLEEAIKLYRKNYDEIAPKTVKLFPEVKETLKELRQKGIKIALVSSKGEKALKKLLANLEINHFFSLIIGEEKMKKEKPAPNIINAILKKQNIESKAALIVGDTIYDVQMGKNANCRTCAVSYGYGNLDEVKKQLPDHIIKNFSELLKIVF